jgi:8-oxo-dGTP pyrophosphatase MutT (NUDIX family)
VSRPLGGGADAPADDRAARAEVPVEDAVAVVILRDRPRGSGAGAEVGPDDGAGLEVLLLERHHDSVFAPGALVFPGGKLDASDELPDERVRMRDPRAWVARLGVADVAAARAMLAAAVRETFEESGLLLAVHADGRPLAEGALPDAEVAALRAGLAARGSSIDWRPWLAQHELVLDLDALAMWSWWVTPVGPPRRYDTRFLIARAPSGQAPSHDQVETTSMRWITPRAALDAYAAGDLHLIFPTRRTLEQLDAYRDADAVLDAARTGQVDLRRIQPTVVVVEDVPMVQHPDGGPPAPV